MNKEDAPKRSDEETQADKAIEDGQNVEQPSEPAPEKTARQINKEISEELKREKQEERAKVSKRDVGTGIGALERAERKYKGDIFGQLSFFFQNYLIKAGTGRTRYVSNRTGEIYRGELFKMLEALRDLGKKPAKLSELGQAHAIALMRRWSEQGLAISTIQNRISILRRFLTFIGKDKIIPKGDDLTNWIETHSIDLEVRRNYVPTESKAWNENGVDQFKVIEAMREICPITAIQLELQAAFGLRMKESLQLNPRGADFGNVLRVVYGTKGGLPRDVAFDQDQSICLWQRDVLERAKMLALQNRKGTVSLDGKSLKQSKWHFYNKLKKAGVTKKDLGVTAHGLRHEYAARRYKQITGMDTPVSSLAPSVIDEGARHADRIAREEISKDLGHFRSNITTAYVGSLPALVKNRKKNVDMWIALTEGNEEFLRVVKEAGIKSAWLAGKAGVISV